MWRYIILGLSTLSVSLMLVSCGENKSANTTVNNPNAINNGCPTGTYYSNGFCYNQNGQQWNGNPGGYQNGYTSSLNFISDNHTRRNATISNAAIYKEFLKKATGMCDQADISGGIYSCDTLAAGDFQLNLQVASAQSTSLRATISVYPRTNGYAWYGYSLPSAQDFFFGLFGFPVYYQATVVKNPLPLEMVVSVINDSKGFEARSYGDMQTAANRSLIQIQVFNGKLEQAAFDYQIAFEGKVFATGRLQKY